MTEATTRTRMKVLSGLFVLIFGALSTRLWFLQVLASEQFEDLADRNQIRVVSIEPQRGLIVDRHGRVLVGNRGATVITVDRQGMLGREAEVLPRLADLLQMPVADLEARLDTPRYAPYVPVPVAEDIDEETIFYIREHQDQFPGVGYEMAALREYPYGELGAHLLGYVGEISQDQLDSGAYDAHEPGDVVGRAGVEATYEEFLYGERGLRSIQVNAQGQVLDRDFGVRPATSGDTLVLSIDAKVQELAERALQLGIELGRRTIDEATDRLLRATGGAVVVMDPTNGQVLALASNPTYDPSVFVGGLSRADATMLANEENQFPQFNRAVQGQYPAGSTFKPFTMAGALHQKLARLDQGYDCPASYEVPGDTSGVVFRNWDPVDRGIMSLADALALSCDTVFYPFGWEYFRRYFHSGRVTEFMQNDLRKMGFGLQTGIDLPGEADGLIATDEFKYDLIQANPGIYGRDEPLIWLPGDNINMAIGQGLSLVTPLQLAVSYSAIANGGTIYQPHVGLRVETQDGALVTRIEPEPTGKLPISAKQVRYIREALRGVTEYGTAEEAFEGFPLDRFPVAGKTGTAEVPPKQDYAWFAAMAPADQPRYVVVAIIEQGGHGATTAAPVVRRILEGLFGLDVSGPLQGGGVTD
jgi:penicillin-binding protein 2